jgi:hypothetical protein
MTVIGSWISMNTKQKAKLFDKIQGWYRDSTPREFGEFLADVVDLLGSVEDKQTKGKPSDLSQQLKGACDEEDS